jgi:hypothetical protein
MRVWFARYTAGAGTSPGTWSAAAPLSAVSPPSFGANIDIAFDVRGNALAVWEQSDGTHDSVWASRYTEAAGWSAPVMIGHAANGDAVGPQIAIDANGNAVAVWGQADSTQGYNQVWSAWFE